MLVWSQVVGTLTSDQIKLNSKSSTRMTWLLELYFKPSVFSLPVPALLLFSNVFKTCSISAAVGGSSFTVTLTSSKCGKFSGWASSGGAKHQVAPSCSSFDQVVPICTNLHQVAPNFTNLFQVARSLTKLYQSAPSCSRPHQSALSCT